jgi:hypothetical protein
MNDQLLNRARELTGILEKTALVHAGLEALIAREAGKRLAALGGSEPGLRSVPRRPSGLNPKLGRSAADEKSQAAPKYMTSWLLVVLPRHLCSKPLFSLRAPVRAIQLQEH